MGKKPNWFQRLFTSKTSASSETQSTSKKKKKWSASFTKSHKTPSNLQETQLSSQYGASAIDADRHAIAVAAATAAVAEAAVAAAKAAAEVVRLTSGGTSVRSGPSREVFMAAVVIQSAFRGYLARRALRALKALVKLQALVRGHIVRKQTSDMVRRMQALVRVQARARASRAQTSEFSHLRTRSSIPHNPVPASPTKYERRIRINGSTFHQFSNPKRYGTSVNIMDFSQDKSYSASTWLDHWMEDFPRTHNRSTLHKDYSGDHEKVIDKILEVDTWKPHLNPKQNSLRSNSPSKYTRSFHKPTSSLSSGDNFSLSSKLPEEADEVNSWTGGNSPRVVSASSRLGTGERRTPFSPSRSECSKRCFNGWPDHPNYMANTASYKAKVRSQSAPRQRVDFEKPLSSQQYVHGYNIYQDPTNCFDRLSSSSLR